MNRKKTKPSTNAKDVYILGIHDGHGSGAAILKNGRVIAAIQEERLLNVKNYSGTPVLSIAKVFEIAGIEPSEINAVALASKIRVTPDPQKVNDSYIFRLHYTLAPYSLFHDRRFINWAIETLQKLTPRSEVFEVLRSLDIRNVPVYYVEHHTCHAACTYYQKPWQDKTLVLTLDGMGDGVSATVGIGEGNSIRRIAQTSYYDSLANNLYSEITWYLGLKRVEHEYKLMGLAPYGDYNQTIDIFRKVIRLNPKKPLEFENISGRYLSGLQPYFKRVLSNKRFDHIAAGVQKHFEDLVLGWVKTAVKETGVSRVACSGGAFLNVKVNKLIRELPEITDSFFYPAPDDGGLPVGAALSAYIDYCRNEHIKPVYAPMADFYYGQEFSSSDILGFLRKKKLARTAAHVHPGDVAALLAKGKTIARFSGRDEWGPRALGNRSILADARNLKIVKKINQDIKQRDFWMPFAPAILDEDKERYLKNARFAPYMIEAFDTTEQAGDLIASLHPYDLTARPQVVNGWNKGYRDILRQFKKLTGVGGLLNTSFNLHGFPIVGSPKSALWTFQNSSLDGLLFDDLLLLRNS